MLLALSVKISWVSLEMMHLYSPRVPYYVRPFIGSLTSSRFYATVSQTGSSENDADKTVPKNFSSIPSPPRLPFVGSFLYLITKYKPGTQHKIMADFKQKYGKAFRLKLFGLDSVVISDPKDAEMMHRNEGKYPKRFDISIWKYPREKRGMPLGTFLSDGEQWQKSRRAIDKPLMVISNVHRYAPVLNDVAADLIKLLLHKQARSKTKELGGDDLREDLFRWSTESVSAFLFDRRIGCLNEPTPENAKQFYMAVEDIFITSQKIMGMTPSMARIIFPFTWRKHVRAWFTAFDIAQIYIDERLEEIKHLTAKGETAEGYLASVVKNGELTLPEIHSTTIELMGAGVDTTATAALWLIYFLSRHPEKQEKLFQEVSQGVTLNDDIANVPADYLKHAPYLKACFRECSRIRPVLMANSRTMPEDTIIQGYNVPKGTVVISDYYLMGNSAESFANPENFEPERWLRSGGAKQESFSRFAANPFGFGPRMCIGRRLAETEIYVLFGQLIRRFRIESLCDKEVEAKTNLLMVPKDPVRIRLVPRK